MLAPPSRESSPCNPSTLLRSLRQSLLSPTKLSPCNQGSNHRKQKKKKKKKNAVLKIEKTNSASPIRSANLWRQARSAERLSGGRRRRPPQNWMPVRIWSGKGKPWHNHKMPFVNSRRKSLSSNGKCSKSCVVLSRIINWTIWRETVKPPCAEIRSIGTGLQGGAKSPRWPHHREQAPHNAAPMSPA